MSIKYYSTGATGTGDGSSWLNAYTTLAAALAGVGAGDFIDDSDANAESTGTASTLTLPGTPANLTNIIDVDHTVSTPGSSNLKLTSTFSATTITIAGSGYVYGKIFTSTVASGTTVISLGATVGCIQKYDTCRFNIGATSSGGGLSIGTSGSAKVDLINPTINFAGAGNSIRPSGYVTMSGGATTGVSPTSLFSTITTACFVEVNRVDFYGCTGTIVAAPTVVDAIFIFNDCRLNPAATPAVNPTVPGSRIVFQRTDPSGATYKSAVYTYYGTMTTETAVVRTGGASDQTNPTFSYKVVPTATAVWHNSFGATPVVTEFNTIIGTARTAKMVGVYNGASLPTNDMSWFDLSVMTDSTSGLSTTVSGTKANILATGSALAADTSAWDGAAPARANSVSYTVGQVIKLASNPGRIFFCIAAGATASSEPAGYASAVDGGSVVDNGATFRAGCRFSLTLSFTAQQVGYVVAQIKAAVVGSFYWDPVLTLT